MDNTYRRLRQILLIGTFIAVAAHAFPDERPNILWITIEDTSPQFVGCYGNQTVSTPNIDRLAGEGIRFTNAFSTNTVCSPSRTSLITGVPTWKAGTGNHRSKYPVPEFMKGFPYYLRQEGYYTSNNNKTDYNVAGEKAYIAEAWNESSGQAGWWGRAAGQPFFAVFNFMDSHQSRTMTWPYEQYRREVLEQLDPAERVSDQAFDVPPFYRDSPEMRKQLARVYNSLKLTDKKIGDLLDRLQQDNLTDSTIIFFFADHGEGIPRGKTNGINLGYRVPFVIWFPPMYRHLSPWGTGVVSDELVSFEDLAPTLISLCGGQVPDHMEGRVLVGPQRDAPPEYLVLAADRSDNGPDMVRTITDGRYVYSRNFMPFMPELRYINYMEIGEIKQEMRKDLAADRLEGLQRSLFEPRPAASGTAMGMSIIQRKVRTAGRKKCGRITGRSARGWTNAIREIFSPRRPKNTSLSTSKGPMQTSLSSCTWHMIRPTPSCSCPRRPILMVVACKVACNGLASRAR